MAFVANVKIKSKIFFIGFQNYLKSNFFILNLAIIIDIIELAKFILILAERTKKLTFADLKFIFAFLPITLLLYYLLPKKFKNPLLLLASIVFYAFGSIPQLGILSLDIIVNYLLSILISKKNLKPIIKKALFSFIISLNVLLLIYFKYNHTMPIGISFYTFQMIAFQIDVFRKDIKPEKSFIRFATFMFFFPKIQQGPIARYSDLSAELCNNEINIVNLEDGFRTFILGLSYKALIADKLGGLWHQVSVIGYDSISTPMAWLGMFTYTLQLYFDFHGYSLMAMGIGKMFGFSIPRNFEFPYLSKSIAEFYRRWHVTLGFWFRDYIYFPLGGSRCKKPRMVLNLLIVWLITGFWHGGQLNFILWGFALFVFIAIEKLFLKDFLQKSKIISHLYVLLVIPLTWMLFAITDFSDMGVYFSRLFPFFSSATNVNPLDFVQYLFKYSPFLIAGCGFLFEWPEKFLLESKGFYRVATNVFLFLFFAYGVYTVHTSASNPFMYLQF